ncbi:MAG: preprotein translocase subunit SecY [Clostridia bacterium]|nr:preprotein translocase subunit SecY [Clostridia bacterium]
MFRNLINAFKNKEIRNKILITIGLLFIYRLGCWLPIPGISGEALIAESDTLMNLMSQIGGNALANGAFLALGISPYINASIIVQLLTVAIPALERWSRQGEDGRKKIALVTKIATLALAILQAVGIAISWVQGGGISDGIFTAQDSQVWIAVFVAAMLVAGSMVTMWLGDRITELGVGNGISLIIFVGIVASAGLAIAGSIEQIVAGGEDGTMAFWGLLIFLLLVILIFLFIVFIDLSERKIVVNYAKQVKGRKQYGGQSSNIPIKVNANGVLPIIFSTAILTLPQMIARMFASTESLGDTSTFYGWWTTYLGTDSILYFVLLGVLIMAFSFFYTTIQFKPDEIARNLQQYGGSIQGIRPGKATAEYLNKVSKRLTFWGALFLMIIAIVPSVVFQALQTAGVISNMDLINAFTATGLLIVVSVALELNKQLEGLLMMKRTRGFLK